MPVPETDLEIRVREYKDLLGDVMTDDMSEEEARAIINKKLESRRWRLDNLYYLTNEAGEVLKFKMKYAQKLLFLGFHYCNIILKSRQHGITTFICILYLDTCLFNSNMSAAIIAHNKEDAKDFFEKKVKFAYDRLPGWLKEEIPAKTDAVGVLSFANGSSLRVTTSGRSGTYQLVHISEFGKMCAKFPAKAEEVITGTLNTVHPGQLITIESTAEGREGRFYDMCVEAMKAQDEGRELGKLDYKFFFFGAPENDLNYIDTPVPIPKRLDEYFQEQEAESKRILEPKFKYWYVSKEKTQGEFMKREHPLSAKEAFEQSMLGAYYIREMTDVRKNKRICRVPYKDGVLVHTFWDLGFNELTAIWFIQMIGREVHVIDYYENSGEGLLHYADYLKNLRDRNGEPYRYGSWYAPHDIMVHEYTAGKTRIDMAREVGISFQVGAKTSKPTQIQAVRNLLPLCWFDEERCEKGIARLDGYRKQWNDQLGCWRDQPLKDDNTHGADAFAVAALELKGIYNYSEGPAVDLGMRRQVEEAGLDPTGWT
jgi:hypothetical protein